MAKTISEIIGGKFANGAVSAAFVHLFNFEIADPRLNGQVGRAMGGDGGLLDIEAEFNGKILIAVVSFSPFGIVTALSNATRIGLMMIGSSIKNIYYSGSVMLGANYRITQNVLDAIESYLPGIPSSTKIGYGTALGHELYEKIKEK